MKLERSDKHTNWLNGQIYGYIYVTPYTIYKQEIIDVVVLFLLLGELIKIA